MASDSQEACQAARDKNGWKLFIYNLTRKSKSWYFSTSFLPSAPVTFGPLLTATSPYSYPTFAIGIIILLKTPAKKNRFTSSWLSFVETNRKQTRHFRFPHVTSVRNQSYHTPRIDRSDDDGQYQLTISISILGGALARSASSGAPFR